MMRLSFKNLLPLLLLSLASCWQWERNSTPSREVRYEPVVISRAQLHKISLDAPHATTQNAKIYLKDSIIFVNDRRVGFHIVDNSNPEAPKKLRYLNAPGATDVAVRGGILYINQARDLVALKINTQSGNVQVLKRLENVFPAILSPDGDFAGVSDDKVVIDWKPKNSKK